MWMYSISIDMNMNKWYALRFFEYVFTLKTGKSSSCLLVKHPYFIT
uniref:Alternative protein NEGR1 n=1 Tax=Homo sapiens TaxID=9606 RepID=L8E9Q9_HUMAN|nr:alternative protein NEGR1 [Homo sapiens]